MGAGGPGLVVMLLPIFTQIYLTSGEYLFSPPFIEWHEIRKIVLSN